LSGCGPVQLADFDIEKPDLLLKAKDIEFLTEEIFAQLPAVDISNCRYCSVCSEHCPEKAIQFNRFVPSVTLIVSRCVACGKCRTYCTRNGIRMQEKLSGIIKQSHNREHSFIAGQLPGCGDFQMPLVKAMIERLSAYSTILCDFGPGTGSQVRAGVSAMDAALLVIGPGMGWEADLDILLDLLEKLNIPAGIILNRVNLKSSVIEEIKLYCTKHAVPFLGAVPNIDLQEGNETFSWKIEADDLLTELSQIWSNILEKIPFSSLDKYDSLKNPHTLNIVQ
jgi:MinD superfamily P-loop ATPase